VKSSEKTTVAISKDLYKRLKVLAALDDRTIQAVIDEAVKAWIKEHKGELLDVLGL